MFAAGVAALLLVIYIVTAVLRLARSPKAPDIR